MALETVFLDAGGVLLFPNWHRISSTLAQHGVFLDVARLAAADHLARHRLDLGDIVLNTDDASRAWLYFDLLLTEAGVPLSKDTKAAFEELQDYHGRRNLWELVPDDVVPALDGLCARGLRPTIVSNANGTLCAHLDRLDLTRHFTCVLDSHDVGVEKPDPRFFTLALERAGARPETTIHVGDFYHVDVMGARSAGLRGVLLDATGLYPDADCPRVASLGHLIEMIDGGGF